MGKKPFIDRKTARTYHLVHRSQRDPLIADDSASSRVFREVARANGRRDIEESDEEVFSELPSIAEASNAGEAEAETSNAGEAALCGVYFDDSEYDYAQHLRLMGTDRTAIFLAPKAKPKKNQGVRFADQEARQEFGVGMGMAGFELPQEVLPSAQEMEVGMLNQPAMPEGLQPDMDPELREALTALEDEEYIEEDIVLGEIIDQEYIPGEYNGGDLDEDVFVALYQEEDDECEDPEGDDDDEATAGGLRELQRFKRAAAAAAAQFNSDDEGSDDDRRSMGTKFSMTSSAMWRNDKLQLLDERFERIEEEYNDSDEDDDEDDIFTTNPENLDSILDEFLDKYDVVGRKMVVRPDGSTPALNVEAVRKELGQARLSEKQLTGEGDDEDSDDEEARRKRDIELMAIPSGPKRPEWDCQTVITTYSNMENHPAIIRDRRAPKIVLTASGMPRLLPLKTTSEIASDDDTSGSDEDDESEAAVNKGVARPKKETAAERKARKEAIKEERRDRRTVKKATRSAFKNETKRQEYRADQKSTAAAVTRID